MGFERSKLRTIRPVSVLNAPVGAVWRRVTDFEGINHELMPLMRMRVPKAHRGTSIDNVPLGVPLGRAWLFYGGFLPLDYDALTLTELVEESHFQEVSTMLSMRRWEHRRELRTVDDTCTEVTDVVGFELRAPFGTRLADPVVSLLFRHRHRRLVQHFGGAH